MATRQEIEAQIEALSEQDSFSARQKIKALQAKLAALTPTTPQTIPQLQEQIASLGDQDSFQARQQQKVVQAELQKNPEYITEQASQLQTPGMSSGLMDNMFSTGQGNEQRSVEWINSLPPDQRAAVVIADKANNAKSNLEAAMESGGTGTLAAAKQRFDAVGGEEGVSAAMSNLQAYPELAQTYTDMKSSMTSGGLGSEGGTLATIAGVGLLGAANAAPAGSTAAGGAGAGGSAVTGSTAAMTPEALAAAEAAGFGTTGTAASVGLGTAAPIAGETLLGATPATAPAAVAPPATPPPTTAAMTPLQQLGVSGTLMGLNSILNPAPDTPAAPNTAAINQAQTDANLAAARETNTMNNPNLINQYGTQTFTEPTTPGGRATMTQTLNPEQQALFDQTTQNQMGFSNLAGQGMDSMQGLIGSEFDISSAPAAPGSSDEMRQRVIDSMMSRTDKSLGYQNEAENAALIAAGIRPGTEAYRRAQEQQGYNRNDALMQAEQAAGQEASRSFGMDTEARKNAISELLTQRQTPFNETQALMSGSQVSNPFAGQGYQAGATVQPTNTTQSANMLNQYNTDVYNQQMGTRNANTTAGTNLLSSWMAR